MCEFMQEHEIDIIDRLMCELIAYMVVLLELYGIKQRLYVSKDTQVFSP